MHPMGSPSLGHRVDFALTVDWFCPGCFRIAKNTERISKRLFAAQARKKEENKAHLGVALYDTDEAEQLVQVSYPNGLRITEEEFDHLKRLDGDFSTVKLQDKEVLGAAFRVLRNHTRYRYYHAADGSAELWDYPDLKERLSNLERSK